MPFEVTSTNPSVRTRVVARSDVAIQQLEVKVADIYVAYAGDRAPDAVRFAVDRNPDVSGLVVAPLRHRAATLQPRSRVQFFPLENFSDVQHRFDTVFRVVNEQPKKLQYHSFFRWWLLTEMLRRIDMDPASWIVCIEHDLFLVAPLRPRLMVLRAQHDAAHGGFLVRNALLASTSRSLVAFCHYHRVLWLRFNPRRACKIGRVQTRLRGRRSLPSCATHNATHSYRFDDKDVATSFVLQSRARGWPKWTLRASRVQECVDVQNANTVQWSSYSIPNLTRPLCYVHFKGLSYARYKDSWLRNGS